MESSSKPYPSFDVGPFEGVEKRLIVQFDRRALAPLGGSLRSLPLSSWKALVQTGGCQILSSTELQGAAESCTAFLLSESSLFVYDSCIILKTCGTTTPLLALPVALSFVVSASKTRSIPATLSFNSLTTCCLEDSSSWSSDAPSSPHSQLESSDVADCHLLEPSLGRSALQAVLDSADDCHLGLSNDENGGDDQGCPGLQHPCIAWLLFSHLTYCFPEKQVFPHRSTAEETRFLDQQLFATEDASGMRDAVALETSPGREFFVYAFRHADLAHQSPLTISELMMLRIDENSVARFAGPGSGYNRAAPPPSEKFLRNDTAGALDEFWFEPHGYSCNQLLAGARPPFLTAHISPEPESSYASLEVSFPFEAGRLKEGGSSQLALCHEQALRCFDPLNLHVVELDLFHPGRDSLGSQLLSGQYGLAGRRGFRGAWFSVLHSEYSRGRDECEKMVDDAMAA